MSKRAIREAVRLIRERIATEREHYLDPVYENETRTRYVLIDPLLKACGWDLSDPNQVTIEAWLSQRPKKRIDYLLSLPNDAFIYVEAKLFTHKGLYGWENYKVDITKQLRGYVGRKRDGTAVLTDGNKWLIYDLSRRGRFDGKKTEEFTIECDTLRKCTNIAYQWLNRE